MRISRFMVKAGVAFLAAGLGFGLVAAKAETELVMSSWLPPKHPIVVKLMKPWARDVEKATDGRVSVRVLAKPLGAPPAHYDLAKDGVADITYGLHSFTKDDRFLRSAIGQFSFLGDNAVEVSKAYWTVYSGMLDAQKEHEGVKLLGLFAHGPGLFHNNQRKIESPDDFSGLKIRTPGGYIAGLCQDLGVTTQFMGPGEVYEKLSRGVIDGVTFPMEALKAFKLTDDLKYSMSVPGGLYNTSWFLVVNEAKWNELSDEDKAAIEALSGEAFAERAGAVWDEADAGGKELVSETDIEVYEANDAVLAKVKEVAAKHEADWAAKLSDQGYDGEAALAEMRKLTDTTY